MTESEIPFGLPPGAGETETAGLEAQRRIIQQEEYRRGAPSLETLTSATKPELILSTAARILRDFEDLDKGEAYDRWALKPYYTVLGERARALNLSLEDLKERGIVEEVEGEEGKPRLVTKIAGYSIETRQERVPRTREQVIEEVELDERGAGEKVKRKVRTTKEIATVDVPYYGTKEERELLAKACKAAEQTMIVREKLHNLYAYAYLQNIAALDIMVIAFYLKFPGFSNDQIKALFTLPDFAEFEDNPNNTTFGDSVDFAMRLLFIAARSEKKSKMLGLKETPGWKDIVFAGDRAGKEEEWIGKIDEWEEDDQREKDTTKDEKRGILTKWGNLFAKGSLSEEKRLLRVIEEIVGDKDAVRVAHRFFKISGLAAEEGIERYEKLYEPNKTLLLKGQPVDLLGLELNGEPTTDDLAKIIHFRGYREKELSKNRSAGPEITLDKPELERLATSLLRLAYSKTDHGVRSVFEQWWGYSAEGHMPKESAKKLGEIDWTVKVPKDFEGLTPDSEEVAQEVWNIYALFLFLAGRKEPIKGIYDFLYAEDFDPNTFLRKDFWKHKNKFLSLVLRGDVIVKGEYKELYKDETGDVSYNALDKKKQKEIDESVTKKVKAKGDVAVEAAKKHFWEGVKTLPQWKLVWDTMELKTRPGLRLPPYLTAEADALAKRYGYLE